MKILNKWFKKHEEVTSEQEIQNIKWHLWNNAWYYYYNICKQQKDMDINRIMLVFPFPNNVEDMKLLLKDWDIIIRTYIKCMDKFEYDAAFNFLCATAYHLLTPNNSITEINKWFHDMPLCEYYNNDKDKLLLMQLNWILTVKGEKSKPIPSPVSVRLKIYTDKEFPFDIEYEKSDTNKMTVEKYTNDTLVSKRETDDIFDIYKQLAIEGVLYSDKWRYYEQYSNLTIWQD